MRETREVWRERVARWGASGLTAREFAGRHGFRPGTLSWWKWQLGRRPRPADGGAGPRRRAQVESLAPSMIELRASPVVDDRFEIQVGDRRVRVPPTFDSEALRQLLAALEADR